MMFLSDLVTAYIAARNAERPIGRELAPKSCEQLSESVHLYSRYLERPACCEDLHAAAVNQFLQSIVASGRSAWTARNRRTGLLMLWRFAHRQGLAPPCDGVRPVHCLAVVVDGYSTEQMTRLLRFCGRLRGVVRGTGIPRAIYWDSFLRANWEVGLRIGDMPALHTKHFDTEGWLWTSERKTGKSGWRRISPSTTVAVQRCVAATGVRERIWPGYQVRTIYRAFKELASKAGVGGTSRYIRRGGSSECDKLYPGQGWRFLRHSSPQVWERHYRVDKIVEESAPKPPELGCA